MLLDDELLLLGVLTLLLGLVVLLLGLTVLVFGLGLVGRTYSELERVWRLLLAGV